MGLKLKWRALQGIAIASMVGLVGCQMPAPTATKQTAKEEGNKNSPDNARHGFKTLNYSIPGMGFVSFDQVPSGTRTSLQTGFDREGFQVTSYQIIECGTPYIHDYVWYEQPQFDGLHWDHLGTVYTGMPQNCGPVPSTRPTASPTPATNPPGMSFSRERVRPLLNLEQDYAKFNYGVNASGAGVIKIETQVIDSRGVPISFAKVAFESERVLNTGGHNHGKGPTGVFSLNGSFSNVEENTVYDAPLKSTATVEADINGVATIYYRAFGFAGEEKITSYPASHPDAKAEKVLSIGLPRNSQEKALLPKYPILEKFEPTGLAFDSNFSHQGVALYGTSGTVTALRGALQSIKRLYGREFSISLISLPEGGPVDTAQDWRFNRTAQNPSPAEGAFSGTLHRNGTDVDIALDGHLVEKYTQTYKNRKYRWIFEKYGFSLMNKESSGDSHLRHWHWSYDNDEYQP